MHNKTKNNHAQEEGERQEKIIGNWYNMQAVGSISDTGIHNLLLSILLICNTLPTW